MGVVVAVLLAVLAGVGVAGGVSAVIVNANESSTVDEAVKVQAKSDPVVIVYGKR